VAVFALTVVRPALRDFLATLSEVRLKAAGFEASALRQLVIDANGKKLHDFWKPGGRISRPNAARIAAAMKQLGITGSVAKLISFGTAEDRARVVSSLSL